MLLKSDKSLVLAIGTAICVVVGLYFGSYVWLVAPAIYQTNTIIVNEQSVSYVELKLEATYSATRGTQRFWKRFYAPANVIDRKLRQNKWTLPCEAPFRVD